LDTLKLKSKEPLLRFDQFAKQFGGKVELVLDIKSAGIESEVLQIVASQRLFGSTIFSSFNQKVLATIKLLAPKARTAMIAGPVRNLKMKINLKAHLVKSLKRLHCSDIHISQRIARGALIERLNESGFTVAVWTVDEPEKARELVEMGVDGLFTNDPLLMLRGLRNRVTT
jgi:glycerophosphoryl diester phosphodiesterase